MHTFSKSWACALAFLGALLTVNQQVALAQIAIDKLNEGGGVLGGRTIELV